MADIIQLGERRITNVSSLIILGTYLVANGKATFRQPNGTSGYAVPGGQTLTIIGVQIHAAVGSSAQLGLVYSDNDVGFNSTTAFTNPVYQFGDANFSFFRNPGVTANGLAPGMPQSFATYFQVPTGKYPGINHTGAGGNSIHITIYGTLA